MCVNFRAGNIDDASLSAGSVLLLLLIMKQLSRLLGHSRPPQSVQKYTGKELACVRMSALCVRRQVLQDAECWVFVLL